MEKRLFLAIFISIVILMVYSSIVPRFMPQQPIPQPELTQQSPATSVSYETKAEVASSQAEPVVAAIDTEKQVLKNVQNADLGLDINLRGSAITNCNIKSYNTILPQKNIGLLIDWQKKDFTKSDLTDGATMSYDDKNTGLGIKKEYRFTKDKYIVEMTVEFVNSSNTNRYVKYGFNVGSIKDEILKQNSMDARYIDLSVSLPNKTLRNNFLRFNPKTVDEKIQWIGIRDRYFCTIIKPLQEAGQLTKDTHNNITSYILESPTFELQPGQTIKHTYKIYLGPQEPDLIAKLGDNAENIINFGMFDSVSHILLGALKILHKVSKNWGLTIILFSVLVFVLMSPLSIKSFSSMKRMQELQPLIEELKVKYKDSPQKMHKEIMELYKEKKINPLGGCLPLLLQMPIFVALYQLLMRFIELKGAGFLWIKDLSEPDRLAVLPKAIPVIGSDLNLLPIIMIITMFIQQKLTSGKSQSASTEAARQQKMMGLFMAVFFGVIFYHMPSGLVLYWAVNSILMLVFQVWMFIPRVQKA
ncbi:MAG: membrane protein insertase YidC [Candidatus Omnitrophica bacterium]|nr:membrane protein insertase YidC [Candidatus Omnitrophota bacterium]MDD5351607.1 membrane protein insertase YidC [Candidatus Omnitrophota bacterium]MDD5550816.1 membrane protein insertase YidC [Candidatus Omnitrophota bacterium]